jgi:predicted porin
MRHQVVAGIMLAAGASCAMAQTTIYGQVAAAIRSTSNLDPAGATRTELTGTNIGSGALGFRGVEALGNGYQLRYRIEGGFFTDSGIMRHGGLFGREASIGIDGPFGKLDVGRLQIIGNASEVLVRADPLRGAGPVETVWPGIWTGARYDNAIRWRTPDSQPLVLSVLYSAGEAGSTGAGRTMAANAGYLGGGGVIMGSYQVSQDAGGKQSRVYTAGGTIIKLPLTLHGAYMHARRDKGYTVGALAGTALFNTDQAFAGIRTPADLDVDFYLLGVTAQFTPRWRLRSAVFYSDTDGGTVFSATRGGTQRTVYAMLSYDFSARTSLLIEMDYNRWGGGWSGFWGATPASLAAYRPDGHDTRRTASVGLNHNF